MRIQTNILHPNNFCLVASWLFADDCETADPHQVFLFALGATTGEGQLNMAHHIDVDVFYDRVLTRWGQYLKR